MVHVKAASVPQEEVEPTRSPRYYDIISSSIEVFSRTNYEKATTALLAKEAGVAEGTLYKYFPNKKELFLECFRYICQLLIGRYTKIYQETKHDPLNYMLGIARSYYEFLQENPSMRRFLAFVLNNSFDKDFRGELDSFVKFNVREAERMIQQAMDIGEFSLETNPKLAAWVFVGGYFTLILMAELDAEEFQEPGFINDMMKFILR